MKPAAYLFFPLLLLISSAVYGDAIFQNPDESTSGSKPNRVAETKKYRIVQNAHGCKYKVDGPNRTMEIEAELVNDDGSSRNPRDFVDLDIYDGPDGNDYSSAVGKSIRTYCANPAGEGYIVVKDGNLHQFVITN